MAETYSAYPPPPKRAITSSPGFFDLTSLPTRSTTPLHSSPKTSLLLVEEDRAIFLSPAALTL